MLGTESEKTTFYNTNPEKSNLHFQISLGTDWTSIIRWGIGLCTAQDQKDFDSDPAPRHAQRRIRRILILIPRRGPGGTQRRIRILGTGFVILIPRHAALGPGPGPWAMGPWAHDPWAQGPMAPWAHGAHAPMGPGPWAHGPFILARGPWAHGPLYGGVWPY